MPADQALDIPRPGSISGFPRGFPCPFPCDFLNFPGPTTGFRDGDWYRGPRRLPTSIRHIKGAS
jgi:hypothetical protein